MSTTGAKTGYIDLFQGILWRSRGSGDFFKTDSRGDLVPISSAIGILSNGEITTSPKTQVKLLKFIGYIRENEAMDNIKSVKFQDEGLCIAIFLKTVFKTSPTNKKLSPMEVLGFEIRSVSGSKKQPEALPENDGGSSKKPRIDTAVPSPQPVVVSVPVTNPAKDQPQPAVVSVQVTNPAKNQPRQTLGMRDYGDGALKLFFTPCIVMFENKTYQVTHACLVLAGGCEVPVPLGTEALVQAIDTLRDVRHSRGGNKVYYPNCIPTLVILGKTGVKQLEIHYNPIPVVLSTPPV
uniref:Uncharacterized protein n=1 Tax=Cryptomonas curvata TaxID=233186 RepID=A0A7S0QC80_9CRYP|mmetsp:Transcript_10120/g.21619  ORF Transcript_10120/g.21619 Transcript_10120/m.21619 type:complete len:293 (+) Transcript_10120:54-932(+)